MNRKKILALTSRLPYPLVGGDRLRIYAICRELSKRYAVTLLSLCEHRAELEMTLPDDGVFAAVERVLLPPWRSKLNCLRALPTAKPLQVAYYESAAYRDKLTALLPAHDLAFAHLIRTAHYLRDCDLPTALEMTDAISLNYARVVAHARADGVKNLVYGFERRRLLAYERAVVARFGVSFLVSKVDKDFLFPPDAAPPGGKVVVCTNGVDFERIRYDYQPAGKTLVFIGNMTSVQNLDAARWFCRRALPLLRQAGDWQLKIIGRIGAREQSRFNRHAGVTATGAVADVTAHTQGAFAGVCPVRLAAGVQNKILEYMALGLPCIASPTGGEGLGARDGEEIVLADSAAQYAAEIRRLYDNPSEARRLSVNARKYVEANHAWSDALAPMVEVVAEVLTPAVILER